MARSGSSAADYVEVYDEPLHRVQFANEYVLVYTVLIPRGVSTLWHRHQEDTVYCAIRDVAVAETLPGQAPCVRHTACGTAVSRAHKAEPLIHQVTNAGDDVVQFVAAEARARSPGAQASALVADGHVLAWESPRFRVYRLRGAARAVRADYPFHGLFVALAPTILTHEAANGTPSTLTLDRGDWRWLEPGARCDYAGELHGILAEWR